MAFGSAFLVALPESDGQLGDERALAAAPDLATVRGVQVVEAARGAGRISEAGRCLRRLMIPQAAGLLTSSHALSGGFGM